MMEKMLDIHNISILAIFFFNILLLIRTRFVMISLGLYRVLDKHINRRKTIPNYYVYLIIFVVFSILMCMFSPIVYFQMYGIQITHPDYRQVYTDILFIGMCVSFVCYIAMEVIGVRINCKIVELQHHYQMKMLERMGV